MRTLIKYGVDSIKLNLSGEEITGMARRRDADVRGRGRHGGARGEAAATRAWRPMPARPARSSNASAMASRTSITPRSPTKRRSTCWKRPRTAFRRAGPRLADQYRAQRRANGASSPDRSSRCATSANSKRASKPAEDASARHPRLIGGDYGFAWTPQGTNAKDIEYFVDMLGFSPMEAIVAATQIRRRDHGHGRTNSA